MNAAHSSPGASGNSLYRSVHAALTDGCVAVRVAAKLILLRQVPDCGWEGRKCTSVCLLELLHNYLNIKWLIRRVFRASQKP